ncbi:MAG: hypothetical protein MUF16_04050 [Burkholderiaceae bacterium]|nr:hypothetical protein [Burkholderiaceae bacterium]
MQGLGPGLRLAFGLLGRQMPCLAFGFQRSDPLAFGSLGGFASTFGREAFGLGTLSRQPFFLGTPFGFALRLGPGFGVACGLLCGKALGRALGFRGGETFALGSFDGLTPTLGREALRRLLLGRPAFILGTPFGLALRLGLRGSLALRLALGVLGGHTFMFGSFGGLALTFGLDALGLGALCDPAFVFGSKFSLALQLGPRDRVVPGLLVAAHRVGTATKDLPADQQAQARSDQQPKEVFAHEWNVRRKRCGEHRCESAMTPCRR